jgi:hypothetical protein
MDKRSEAELPGKQPKPVDVLWGNDNRLFLNSEKTSPSHHNASAGKASAGR